MKLNDILGNSDPFNGWVNPDEIYGEGTTFIYTSDGKLYVGDTRWRSHGDMIRMNRELIKRYSDLRSDQTDDSIASYREAGEEIDLFGRVGQKGRKDVVTFWNMGEQPYSHLDDCIESLADAKLIDDTDFLVSTPLSGTYQSGLVKSAQGNRASADDVKRAKELHLMTAAEKNRALKNSGVKPKRPISLKDRAKLMTSEDVS